MEITSADKEGYPLYKRKDYGRVMENNGIFINNRYVVPYNLYLLLKYNAHINAFSDAINPDH